jgi:hypothetical protein
MINYYPKEILAKQCRLCGVLKKESQFRYIKHFRKHRLICKKCEARERQKKRRAVETHVKEYGVTPGIRRRLEFQVGLQARTNARERVFSDLNPRTLGLYRWAQRVSRICSIGLSLSVFFLLFALAGGFYIWMALPLVTGGSPIAARRHFNRRHADPVDKEIDNHQRA